MKKILLAVFALIAFLTGCAPTMQELSATCVGYGFTPDTDAFLECRQREMNTWEAQQTAMAVGLWM